MILVDTSVWIGHLRGSDETLARLLDSGEVLAHPFVIGELALGNLHQRESILTSGNRCY
jgi:predicted nucleic acid-binding protein